MSKTEYPVQSPPSYSEQSDRESDISEVPKASDHQFKNVCLDCYEDCFGCCTGHKNLPGSDKFMLGNLCAAICCLTVSDAAVNR
ncbi:unnamed protein product [Candida verbasci]|uniref:Uncharacterized protein n=1 Tax=Candida verbasci TaxID=1227364 RepID=A0A9W4TXA1_9ASCO|nr:unnamed protein product [Candida verbasci]